MIAKKLMKLTPDNAPHLAKAAGLRYVCDNRPGITRVKRGRKFTYVDERGRDIRKVETLQRIHRLAIPPAWTDVWICPDEWGHLQATGKDARGRKQYRYHTEWDRMRDEVKFDRVVEFARALPKIRKRVAHDLKLRGLPREKVLAAVVRLLETTLIRVGNDEYAQKNDSFGLTTLQDKHVRVRGKKIVFDFRGKSGIRHEIDLHDPQLARIVGKCQDLPGQELLQYVDDDGNVRDVGSADVNDYLREISGGPFTAKDFRTWAGTALAARALQEFQDFDSQAAAKRRVTSAIEQVAKRLGNTKAVCRKCYVHPAIIQTFLDRRLVETLQDKAQRELRTSLHKLTPEEGAVLGLLEQWMKNELRASCSTQRNGSRRTTRKTPRAQPRRAAARRKVA